MITIEFKDVGSNKKSWVKTFAKQINTDDIAREAKAHGALMSSCVDAELFKNGEGGLIIVGGWRVVGEFKILA